MTMKQKFYLVILSLLAFSPCAVAEEEDTRTQVSSVSATTNISVSEIAGYGKETIYPTFTMSDGSVAFINSSMSNWIKKDSDGNWVQYDEDVLTEGTYCLSVQVRIEGEYGPLYVLADEWGLNVNGEPWQTVCPSVGSTYCYAPAYSPEITVKKHSGISGVFTDDSSSAVPVYNLQGILVKQNALNEDLQSLPAGLYIVAGKKVIVK